MAAATMIGRLTTPLRAHAQSAVSTAYPVTCPSLRRTDVPPGHVRVGVLGGEIEDQPHQRERSERADDRPAR